MVFHFSNKDLYSQSYGFSCSHVRIWELDHKEGWALKNWCFWTMELEKTPESLLDCNEITPINSKGIQPWTFIEWTVAESPILWPPEVKSWLIWKDLVLGKTEVKKRRRQQRMRWLDSISDSMDINLSKLWEIVEDRGAWHASVHVVAKSQTWLSD